MKKQKNKIRKSQILQIVAIIGSIILSIALISYLSYKRIEHLGGLYVNHSYIIAVFVIALLIGGTIYVFLGVFISLSKEQELNQEKFLSLKEYLNGKEKEVKRKYSNGYDAIILKSVVDDYGLHYFARIENEKIILITRDDDGKESSPIETSANFFRQYFEF